MNVFARLAAVLARTLRALFDKRAQEPDSTTMTIKTTTTTETTRQRTTHRPSAQGQALERWQQEMWEELRHLEAERQAYLESERLRHQGNAGKGDAA